MSCRQRWLGFEVIKFSRQYPSSSYLPPRLGANVSRLRRESVVLAGEGGGRMVVITGAF